MQTIRPCMHCSAAEHLNRSRFQTRRRQLSSSSSRFEYYKNSLFNSGALRNQTRRQQLSSSSSLYYSSTKMAFLILERYKRSKRPRRKPNQPKLVLLELVVNFFYFMGNDTTHLPLGPRIEMSLYSTIPSWTSSILWYRPSFIRTRSASLCHATGLRCFGHTALPSTAPDRVT